MKTAAYVICFIVGGSNAAVTLMGMSDLFPLGDSSTTVNYLVPIGFGMVSVGLLVLGDRLVRSQYRPRPVVALRASYVVGAVCVPLVFLTCYPPTYYTRSKVIYTNIELVLTNDSAVLEESDSQVPTETTEPID